MRTKEENIKYMEKLGVKFDNIPRNFLTINLVNNAGFNIRTPITFTMGESDLDKVVSFISELGLPGRRVIKALVRSIKKLTQPDLDKIKNNFWIVGYTPEDIIRYSQNILMDTLRYHRVPVIPILDLDKGAIRNFIKCFGGIKGVERLFTEVIEKTSDEFSRIQKEEAKLNKNKIESEISSDVLGSVPLSDVKPIVKQCFTCKWCHTTSIGHQLCMRKARPIPPALTVDVVNKMYPTSRTYNCCCLKSRYILHDVHTCEDYLTRVF
jgi:hypothetical protein